MHCAETRKVGKQKDSQKFGFIEIKPYLCRNFSSMDMQTKDYKYRKELDELLAVGCQLPTLHAPNNMHAYRFASSQEGFQNHIPQYISNPKRMLQDISKGNANTSLISLSCFDTAPHAESFYENLQKAFKNISNSIGDSLSEGNLKNEDGVMTTPASNGHFDFYEYIGCDLNKSFVITKNMKDGDEKD